MYTQQLREPKGGLLQRVPEAAEAKPTEAEGCTHRNSHQDPRGFWSTNSIHSKNDLSPAGMPAP